MEEKNEKKSIIRGGGDQEEVYSPIVESNVSRGRLPQKHGWGKLKR